MPKVTQPFYTDNLVLYRRVRPQVRAFHLVYKQGSSVGYFPEPKKLRCVCPRSDKAAIRAIFAEENLKVNFTRGMRYVGG